MLTRAESFCANWSREKLLEAISEAHIMGVEELMSAQYRALLDALAKKDNDDGNPYRT